MANPLPLTIPPRDAREELRSRLEAAPLEHAEALLAGYQVLQGLHDRGLLELLRGALGAGDQLLEIAVKAAESPEAIRGLRNLLILVQTMGSIDPAVLKRFAEGVPVAMATATREPPGLVESLRLLVGKNLRRGLAIANSLLGTR